MQPLKILQVFDFLSLPRGGGTVDIVYKLSRALSERGHNVTICTGNHDLDEEYINALAGVDVKVMRSWYNKHGIYLMPGLLRFDVSLYDVIHLHCYRSFQNEMICHGAMRRGIPYMIDAHGSTVDLPGRKRLLRLLYDLVFGLDILANAKCLIAETETGVAEYTRLGVRSDKIKVLHPLLDTSEFSSLPEAGLFRSRYGIGTSFIILFIGRVHPAKGIETLVDATQELLIRGRDARLVIVGQDDGFVPNLQKQTRDRGIADRVLFTGFLTGVDKLSALVDADVLVQPSRNEAGARPSLEAILCGTPIAVTRGTGAGQEVSKFDGGLLFDYGHTSTLVDALWFILDNRDTILEKTRLAKVYIETNLSLDKQVTEYEKLYNGIVA